MQQMTRNSVIVAPIGGGILELISADGEILAHFPVPAGRSKATRWLDLCGPGQTLSPGDEVMVLEPSHRIYTQTFGDEAFTSSANPDFRVSSADRFSRNLDRRLRKLEVVTASVRAREAVLDRKEAAKLAAEKTPELVEPSGDPASPEVAVVAPADEQTAK